MYTLLTALTDALPELRELVATTQSERTRRYLGPVVNAFSELQVLRLDTEGEVKVQEVRDTFDQLRRGIVDAWRLLRMERALAQALTRQDDMVSEERRRALEAVRLPLAGILRELGYVPTALDVEDFRWPSSIPNLVDALRRRDFETLQELGLPVYEGGVKGALKALLKRAMEAEKLAAARQSTLAEWAKSIDKLRQELDGAKRQLEQATVGRDQNAGTAINTAQQLARVREELSKAQLHANLAHRVLDVAGVPRKGAHDIEMDLAERATWLTRNAFNIPRDGEGSPASLLRGLISQYAWSEEKKNELDEALDALLVETAPTKAAHLLMEEMRKELDEQTSAAMGAIRQWEKEEKRSEKLKKALESAVMELSADRSWCRLCRTEQPQKGPKQREPHRHEKKCVLYTKDTK